MGCADFCPHPRAAKPLAPSRLRVHTQNFSMEAAGHKRRCNSHFSKGHGPGQVAYPAKLQVLIFEREVEIPLLEGLNQIM